MGCEDPCGWRDWHAGPAPQVGEGWAAEWAQGEISFLTFPTAGAGARVQTPGPKTRG